MKKVEPVKNVFVCRHCRRRPRRCQCPDTGAHYGDNTARIIDIVTVPKKSVEPDQVGYLVLGDRCDRCGDVNFDEGSRVCLTCTYPDDPCSVAYLDSQIPEHHSTITITVPEKEVEL